MLSEVLEGLARRPKRLPSKFFYDERGSELFERICEQPEYYLTRAELQIMRRHGAAIASMLGDAVRLVEFGSGAGIKTDLLLGQLASPALYMPVDISHTVLEASVAQLRSKFPDLAIHPLAGDFTHPLTLPEAAVTVRRTAVYFPGSTLGNFESHEALGLLRNIRKMVGRSGAALIGVDLKKDAAVTQAAYNDKAGVTAAFTLNMLTHVNRKARSNFDVANFAHRAVYDEANSRIQTDLVSLARQAVRVGDSEIDFYRGEAILVEYSHKYTLADIDMLAAQARLKLAASWLDDESRFAVAYLVGAP